MPLYFRFAAAVIYWILLATAAYLTPRNFDAALYVAGGSFLYLLVVWSSGILHPPKRKTLLSIPLVLGALLFAAPTLRQEVGNQLMLTVLACATAASVLLLNHEVKKHGVTQPPRSWFE